MFTGMIKFFLTPKNYGFIVPHEGGKDVMFHVSALEGGPTIREGNWVTYSDVIDTPKGPKALRVALCKKRGEHERSMDRERSGKVLPFGSD